MKITEDIITQIAYETIKEIASSIYEVDGKDQSVMLGEIAGIIDLARALKEVLKA